MSEGRGKGTEKESQTDCPLSVELDVGLDLMSMRSDSLTESDA